MTGRDRIVVIGIAVLLVLGAAWMLVVSPERKQAAALNAQVSAATAQLASADSKVANARSAQLQYSAAYASIVRLGKAVPPGEEVPALMYQIAHATNQKHVEFSSITTTGTGSSTSSAASQSAPTASSAPTGFTQMPFTFVFNGSFLDLYHLFQQLNRFTVRTASGVLFVNGRLLTIQSVKLAPSTTGSTKGNSEQLSGNVTATAYVLPATQGLTAGATAGSPAGLASQPSTSPATKASTPAAPSTPTAPAIARVTP